MTEYDRFKYLPVIPLGHTGTKTFYYFVRSTRQVVALGSASHRQHNFIGMAEEADWQCYYPAPASTGRLDWDTVAENLMAHCREIGLYDPSRVRGRGAWRDGDDVVFHSGDALFVNGQLTDFRDYTETDYHYLAEIKTLRPADDKSSANDGEELLSVFRTWGWEHRSLAPNLILGWIGCSLICGALQWRPHLWITGIKGSGKSTLDSLIFGILGDLALHVQGNTTEPGLRQTLKGDARPVLFDEFEAENANAMSVIDAARSAASDNAAPVIKGTPEGKPIFYRLRFSGMFSGILANVQKETDRSRFVILEMHPLTRTEDQRRQLFENLIGFGSDFGARLLRRMLDTLTSGRFEVSLSHYRKAIRLAGGDERKADVFAHLLAAHHVLTNDSEITNAADVASAIADLDEGEPSDEEACLSHLLGHLVTVDYGYKRTLGEWIGYLSEDASNGPSVIAVQAELERHGVKLDGNKMKIANATTGIKNVYKGSRWKHGSHRRILQRLDGAKIGGKAWFAGNQSRCTVIPCKPPYLENGL